MNEVTHVTPMAVVIDNHLLRESLISSYYVPDWLGYRTCGGDSFPAA